MIIDIMLRLISFIIYIFLVNFFFSNSYETLKFSIKDILYISGLAGAVILNSLIAPSYLIPYINIAITIILIAFIATLHSIPVREIFFLTTIFLSINFISESLVFSFSHSLFTSEFPLHHKLIEIVTTSISTIVEMFLILGIKIIFFKNRIYLQELPASSLLALTSIPIISIVILLSFLFTNIKAQIDFNFFQLLIVLGITYMNLCTLYLYNSLTKHLKQINQISFQNKALQSEIKYVSEVKKSQLELKKIRHDLKNRFLVLLGLIEENKLEQAKEYLEKSIDIIKPSKIFFTNDPVLNYLLNEKNMLAKKNNIQFNIQSLISKRVNLDDDILSVLIGNLIDNALEANIRLKNSNKYINLTIKEFEKNILIDISNPYESNEQNTRSHRKIDGLGIKNIKSIVNIYNGLYKVSTDNNVYSVSIVLLKIL